MVALLNIQADTKTINDGMASLGIELGSTNIKAVLIDDKYRVLSEGKYTWENKLVDGFWTYDLDEVWLGIQSAFSQLIADIRVKYHIRIKKIRAIGVSGMMHGYLAFDKGGNLLVPFRTWRNNTTSDAADKLTKLFGFNIPQRWSIAHLYQAILNGESHVSDIASITTLAGYVHRELTGENVLGVGDASGMFPIDNETGNYNEKMLIEFSSLSDIKKYSWDIRSILPNILSAGKVAGILTDKGAKLLDPSGELQAGSIFAPPEGDAGTGMVSTNSVRKCTGNISVGTSAFSMNVLQKPLQKVHRNVDIVATPDGLPVAMVHVNNCSSDINAWANLFKEFAERLGMEIDGNKLYETLFDVTTRADPDGGKLINYSYLSGENITNVVMGRPLFYRAPDSKLTLANFFLTQLYAAFAPLRIGMNSLIEEENIQTDVMVAQGGLFKTPVIGQQVLANALRIPITIMSTASEGGPWGMAVLAAYAASDTKYALPDFLDNNVFKNPEAMTLMPEEDGVAGYNRFLDRYVKGVSVEMEAGKMLPKGD